MDRDETICYCAHVPLRKLLNFAKRERPKLASEMTGCLGAGTGCGWCIPTLKMIADDPDRFAAGEIIAADYAAQRDAYRAAEHPRNTF